MNKLKFSEKNCRYDLRIGCLMRNDNIGLNLETARMLKEIKKENFRTKIQQTYINFEN